MALTLRTVLTLALLLSGGIDPLIGLLPTGGVPAGWQRQGPERLFVGAELYRHINGGAELYNRFGFDRLAVQDYSGNGGEVRLEIYRMNDDAGAAGVFTEITQGMARQTLYGAACTLDPYQILFQRGVYCVSLTTYEPRPETQAAMAALAAKTDAAIAGLGR